MKPIDGLVRAMAEGFDVVVPPGRDLPRLQREDGSVAGYTPNRRTILAAMREGWIEPIPGKAGRLDWYRLTEKGHWKAGRLES